MTQDPEVLTLTCQTERLRDPEDPESWYMEDSEVFQTQDPDRVLDFLRLQDKDGRSHDYYLTVWSGDPQDLKSEILGFVSGEDCLLSEDWREFLQS